MSSFWDWTLVPRNLGQFWVGLRITLQLAALSLVGCFAFGIVFGMLRASKRRWVSWPAGAVVEVIRGTPALLFIFWIYFFLPVLTGLPSMPFLAGAVALVLHDGAYAAEVVRAGIASVPKGQADACYSLGMTYLQAMRHVVLPQAFRNMVPALINRAVALFKNTSLVYAIGVIEFFRSATIVNAREQQSYTVYAFVAAVYFVCCFSLSRVGYRLGRRPGSLLAEEPL